ncbi:MAG: hypothetical protein ABGW77_06975 [Campylobacterales bacterium]
MKKLQLEEDLHLLDRIGVELHRWKEEFLKWIGQWRCSKERDTIKLNDIPSTNREQEREAIKEAIRSGDEEFLKAALDSPILCEENKELIRNYFRKKE